MSLLAPQRWSNVALDDCEKRDLFQNLAVFIQRGLFKSWYLLRQENSEKIKYKKKRFEYTGQNGFPWSYHTCKNYSRSSRKRTPGAGAGAGRLRECVNTEFV